VSDVAHPRLLIVWHSATGGSAAMAQAAADAAREVITTVSKPAQSATATDLVEADGYLFACPENLASMTGIMKDFFDRCYYPALGRIEGRPYGVMICAGADGDGAARQIGRIATGWRLRAVAAPLIICTHAQTPQAIMTPKLINASDLARCRELGAALAHGLSLGVF
jgi:flavodoxin